MIAVGYIESIYTEDKNFSSFYYIDKNIKFDELNKNFQFKDMFPSINNDRPNQSQFSNIKNT